MQPTTDQDCVDPDSGEEDFRWQAINEFSTWDEDRIFMSQSSEEVMAHGN